MTGNGNLATMMARRSIQEISSMNLENILHMQAELQYLEIVINEVRRVPGLNSFDQIWIERPEKMSEEDICQIFERSRTLLDQYRRNLDHAGDRDNPTDHGTDRALLQTAKINGLPNPRKD
ncbi:uncharacterized protein Z518_06826 [Rhinocladiella mackenziei CBS 650.93]|uniref:Uncharacterized protein n=1 Tax=Rhinocladiella mackenziei CBS 650.93 TaxID=1442369 RepID=A0A0D2IBT2_9EURO|nr:uncharacterized protein Z518_06826 [Rhinocladiella mackenziei CBS 650.93]KIX03274.1 hypothetical protein Z518_06826 [Rhinocladiella mackenziei CBS 650.93]